MTIPANDVLLTLVARHNIQRIGGNGEAKERHSARPTPTVLEEITPTPLGLLLTSETPPPIPYIDDGILFPGTVMVIGGASKARKSWLAMDLVLSLISGTPFLTHAVPEKLRVLYLGGEGMEWKLKRDFRQAVAFKPGIEEADLGNLWALPTLGRIKIDTDGGENWLQEWAQAFHVITIDPYYRFLSRGKENDHADQRLIQDIFDRLKGQGKAVVLCHHLRKPTGEDAGAAELRGAGLDQFADSILILRRKRTATSDRTTLKYTLRNAPEPDDLELTNQGPLLLPAENPDRLVTMTDVKAILRDAGGKVEGRQTFVEALRRMTGAKDDTARKAIYEAESKGIIWVAKRADDKRVRVYTLKEKDK
jgi:hypothetical protein